MKDEKVVEALKRFDKACSEMLRAENHLAVVTRVDFSGVWQEVYKAQKFAQAWLEKEVGL